MKIHFFLLIFIVLIALAPAASAETKTSVTQGSEIEGPFLGQSIEGASFDGDVRKLPARKLPMDARERPRPLPPPAQDFGSQPQTISHDPVRQTWTGSLGMPAPIQNFNGLERIVTQGNWPPDTNGDVGPNHYIQFAQSTIAIYSKTGTQLARFLLNDLFSGTGTPCDDYTANDGVVLYDHLADRWVLTALTWNWDTIDNGPYYECIAVSKTANPVSGGWWLYGLRTDDDSHKYFNDYPKLGVWSDGYYMSANLFDLSNSANNWQFMGVRVWALDRASMFNGTLREVHFDLPCATPCYFALFPSNLRGTPPPAGSPNFFVSVDTPNTFRIWKFHADWTTPANSTFAGPTNLTIANFVRPCYSPHTRVCVPELGGEWLDALGDFLMMQLQYRNIGGTESLWANHTVADNSGLGYPTGIRWYEIRNPNGSPYVYQQGTYQPDSSYRWTGSLAVDRQGNMALGYNVSNATMYPAIRYSGRRVTDPPGILTQGETTLVAGTGAQTGGNNRWGDYSAMTVDPVDDCTFWYTNQYYATTGDNWQTRIGSFKFPGCGPWPAPTHWLYLPIIIRN
jgi:hypothetical protein